MFQFSGKFSKLLKVRDRSSNVGNWRILPAINSRVANQLSPFRQLVSIYDSSSGQISLKISDVNQLIYIRSGLCGVGVIKNGRRKSGKQRMLNSHISILVPRIIAIPRVTNCL